MTDKRRDDGTVIKDWRRADRLFEIEGMWFFYTREGAIEGPFANENGAYHRINVYIQIMNPDPMLSHIQVQPRLLKAQ